MSPAILRHSEGIWDGLQRKDISRGRHGLSICSVLQIMWKSHVVYRGRIRRNRHDLRGFLSLTEHLNIGRIVIRLS